MINVTKLKITHIKYNSELIEEKIYNTKKIDNDDVKNCILLHIYLIMRTT